MKTLTEQSKYLEEYMELLKHCEWSELMGEHERILGEANDYPVPIFHMMISGITIQLEKQMDMFQN
jgi:hypothetical protein